MKDSSSNDSSVPGIAALKGKWQQVVGAAKVSWGELTEDELLTVEGHTEKLAGLIQEHYAVTREEAEMQVKRFFARHNF